MNDKNLNKIFGIGLVITLILSIVGITRSQIPGSPGRNGQDGRNVGSVTNPDFGTPYISWGSGAPTRFWNVQSNFLTGTSTLCILSAPREASTTLETFSAIPNTSTTTNVFAVLENRRTFASIPNVFSTSTTATTTNVIQSQNIPSGTISEYVWTATSTGSVGRIDVFGGATAPSFPTNPSGTSTNLAFYAKASFQDTGVAINGGVFPTGGTCRATFREI